MIDISILEKEFKPIFNSFKRKSGDFHFHLDGWDDIENRILLHLYNKQHLYDKERSLPAWIKTVVSNQIINYKRNAAIRNKKESKYFTRYKGLYEEAALINNDPIVYEDNDDLDSKIKELFSKLTEEEIYLIHLIKEGMPIKEAANHLGISKRLVYYRLNKIKNKYKKFKN